MLILPFRTEKSTDRFPLVTFFLVVINVLVYLYEVRLSQVGQLQAAFLRWAVVPREATTNPNLDVLLDFVRSMFFHGGWLHLLGNMLYLYIFGKNVEDTLGEWLYLFFYFFCGAAASLAHIVLSPWSPLPLVGASGAIAGLLGAYLILYPGARVRVFFWFLHIVRVFRPRAALVLGAWFVLQVFQGYTSLSAETAGGGVAYAAHVGGFVTGLLFVWLLIITRPLWAPPGRDERY